MVRGLGLETCADIEPWNQIDANEKIFDLLTLTAVKS